MPCVKEPDAEPIPGYRLLEFLGRGGFGEVWKCEAPGGVFKAIKFVQGNLQSLEAADPQAGQEWKALQLVKTIRHPFLLGIDRLELVNGEVVVVMELADSSLADTFRDCREAGQPGIPRAELLAYLREAAEALDVINLQHQLQHLDIKPANLFLVHRHVKVGDFGLLNHLGDGSDRPSAELGGLTPLYCAPEALKGQVSARSDQFSLAVVYQELVTGRLPWSGRSGREVLLRRASAAPDLSPLSDADRPVVERALSRDPEARYPSCTEFVRALAAEPMPGSFAPSPSHFLSAGPAAAPGSPAVAPDATVWTGHPARQASAASADKSDFAGHRLLGWQDRSPLCDTGKVRAPDGRERLLKFYSGLATGREAAEADALRRLTSLSHRNLLPVEPLRNEVGRIALVCDAKDGTLADRLEGARRRDKPGLPRREVLDALFGVADALDTLYDEQHLQHLWLGPHTLVVDGKRLLIADMGIAQLVWLPAGQPVGRLNGRYAAPELWAGKVSPTCDQYSLAVLFQEMLTSTSPVRGRGNRGKAPLYLDPLPGGDREPIARALSADPKRRFASCADLIEALDRPAKVIAPAPAVVAPAPVVLPPVIAVAEKSLALPDGLELPPPSEVIGQLLGHTTGPTQIRQADDVSYLLEPGTLLKHSCGTTLSLEALRGRLEEFRLHCSAEVFNSKLPGLWLAVPLSTSFWQRCLSRRPSIVIGVTVGTHELMAERLTSIRVEMHPVDMQPAAAGSALAEHGPALLKSLRGFIEAAPERRAQARLPFEHAVGVFPVLDEPRLGEALLCDGKDVLPGGIGLVAPKAPPSKYIYLQPLLTPQLSSLGLLGRVVRAQRLADGRCVWGVTFAREPQTVIPRPGPAAGDKGRR
jgi:serine/threonine protein kinase